MTASIFTLIANETDTSVLDAVVNAARERAHALAKAQVRQLRLRSGDTVTFNDKIRPTYMRGLTATVIHFNNETVTVKCPDDSRYGRFAGSRHVRVPLSLLAV